MKGLQCRPEGNVPVLQKINHLAIRLGGETPDGVFEGGSVALDLSSDAAKRLEAYIGFNAGTAAQTTLLAKHWGEVRGFISALQGSSGTTITQASLSTLPQNAQLNAGVLLESASILLRIFAGADACGGSVLVNGVLPRFNATPAEIRSERNSLTTIASLYVRMGGEDDDGGLPDGTLSAPVTLSDVELRRIDRLVGYRPPAEPASEDDETAGSELQRNWIGVRAMITGLRNEAGVIDDAALDAVTDRAPRETAAVQLQTAAGLLRILNSDAWKAGRAYGTEETVPAPVASQSEDPAVVSSEGPVGVSMPQVVAETANASSPLDGGRSVNPHPIGDSRVDDAGSSNVCAYVSIGAVGVLGGFLLGRRPANATAAQPQETPKPAQQTPKPSEAPSIELGMDDVLKDLENVKTGVTPENVLIRGAQGGPVVGVDAKVIRAQIVAACPQFLSQAAREALQAARPLLPGAASINSNFSRELDEMVDQTVVAYHELAKDADGLKKMWEEQKAGLPIVRRGVPQKLLLNVIASRAASGAQSAESVFAPGRESLSEIDRRANDPASFENLRDVLRMTGR